MGISLGSECSGGIRDVNIEDNLVGVCKPGHCEDGCCGWSPALHLKTADTRGGHMTNIVFRNNTVYNTTFAILLETDYQEHQKDTKPRPTLIENIAFESNRGRGTAKSINFNCDKDLPCKNVTFLNNDFDPKEPIRCKNVKVIDKTGTNICSADAERYESTNKKRTEEIQSPSYHWKTERKADT